MEKVVPADEKEIFRHCWRVMTAVGPRPLL
jgi:hypothetical protein